MFPINFNDPYLKEDGSIIPISEVIGGGGGGSRIYTGNTLPNNSLGNLGDIYLYLPDGGTRNTFELNISKALRGDSEQNYCGAQEIQLFFTNGVESKNIIDFPQFTATSNASSNVGLAFDGNTGGVYWEKSGLPATITFSAKIPIGWELEKLVVWQRNSEQYVDVWKDFVLKLNDAETLLDEQNLTQNDWNGPGTGTTFAINPVPLNRINTVLYKIHTNDGDIWIS